MIPSASRPCHVWLYKCRGCSSTTASQRMLCIQAKLLLLALYCGWACVVFIWSQGFGSQALQYFDKLSVDKCHLTFLCGLALWNSSNCTRPLCVFKVCTCCCCCHSLPFLLNIGVQQNGHGLLICGSCMVALKHRPLYVESIAMWLAQSSQVAI